MNALLTVFPNPANTTLKLTYTTSIAQITTLRLIDVNGTAVVTQSSRMAEGNNDCQVNIATLPAGTYLLLLTNNDGVLAKKTVVVTK